MSRFRETNLWRRSSDLHYVDGTGALPGDVYSKPCLGWSGSYKSINDISTPHFKELIGKGVVVVNDMTIARRSRDPVTTSVFIGGHPTWGPREITGDLPGHIFPQTSCPIETSKDLVLGCDASLVRACARMNSGTSVMTGEALGEISKTLGMMRRPFQNSATLLAKIAKSARRNKLRGGKTTRNVMKATADAWLEHRYGWRPIFLDFDQLVKNACSARDRMRGERLVARGAYNVTRNDVRAYTFPGTTIVGTTGSSCQVRYERIISVNSGVIYKTVEKSKLREQLSVDLSLRARDLPVALWELTAYSFVVDWFTNIGDWIQAIVPNLDIDVLASWTTMVVRATDEMFDCKAWVNNITPAPAMLMTGTFNGLIQYETNVTRLANPKLPTTPSVTLNVPSLTRQADALSLIASSVLGQVKGLRH